MILFYANQTLIKDREKYLRDFSTFSVDTIKKRKSILLI